MASDKKVWEKLFFDLLCESIPDLPNGAIIHDDNPDFIIQGKSTLGIEVTRLYHQPGDSRPPRQVIESQMENVIQIARQLYDACSGAPKIHVSVHFSGFPQLRTRRDRLRAADRLFTEVLGNLPALDAWHEIGHNKPDIYSNLPDCIDSVSIARFSVLTKNFWAGADGGVVAEHFPELLQKTISGKEIHLGSYLERCRHCWLAIGVSGTNPSTFFEASDKTLQHVYDSRFERTYYVELQKKLVKRLTRLP